MSVLSLGLLVALIGVFIWIKWEEKRKWTTVYEAFGHRSRGIQERYHYLKGRNIRCRIKHYTPGTMRMIGQQGAQMSTQSTMMLQVPTKDVDRAMKHLADFNK